jgi:hypothetical protein
MSISVAWDLGAHYDGPPWGTRAASAAPVRYEAQKVDYVTLFYRLLEEWRFDTLASSRIRDKIEHPAFRQILDIGKPAVPLIIRELRENPDFLFLALYPITGDNPVPPRYTGNPSRLVEAWLAWADRNNVPSD